jgi:Putative binding domain, N-terminal
VKQWNAATQQVTTLVSSGLSGPAGVALDAQANLYIADRMHNAIQKVAFGYVSFSSTSLTESSPAGTDSVTAQVLPAGTPLTASSNQSWLTITGVTGGTVNFAFQANASLSSRVAQISVLGQPVTVTQNGLTAQTIAFRPLAKRAYGAPPFTVSANASSGLPVSFSSTTPAVCTVSGATVTIATAGSCTIQAAQAGNATYAPATPVTQTFQVTQEKQAITFLALSDQAFGAGPFPVAATASSGLAVSFASTTTPVCAVSGATVTIAAVGACTIQATQAGDNDYAAAPAVKQTFHVTKGSQTIVFGALSDRPLSTAPFTVSATASSGLMVTFKSQTARMCSVSGNTVTLVDVGACTLEAAQTGDSNYAAAPAADQTFQVTQGTQTIAFGPLSNRTLGSAPFTLSATASSGLTVHFNSQTTKMCKVSGTTVTLVAVGTCTIQATQAGNASYAAATPVDQGFQVEQ